MAALKKAGVAVSSLKIDMEFESIESVKSYLLNYKTYGFLSVKAIFNELKSGMLKIVDVRNLEIERYFYFITQQGDTHFLNDVFLKTSNFK